MLLDPLLVAWESKICVVGAALSWDTNSGKSYWLTTFKDLVNISPSIMP